MASKPSTSDSSGPDWSRNIRDAPDFVALSSKEQSRKVVAKKKDVAMRRMSKSRMSSTVKISEGELKRLREIEKARMVNILMVKTGYCEKEILDQYDSFAKMCPDGSLSKKKFIEVSKDLYGNEASNLSEAIFNIFDEDKSGKIDFMEYMMAINSSKMNTPEMKLNWIFDVFDKVREINLPIATF